MPYGATPQPETEKGIKMSTKAGADIVRDVASGAVEPSDGARQLEALFEGGIQEESASDPRVTRVQALLDEIRPEVTPGIITIIVTIKRC